MRFQIKNKVVPISLAALGAVALAGCPPMALTLQTKNEISIKMASSQPGFKACYEKALKGDENLGGSIKLSFVVAPDGQFSNVQTTGGTLNNADVKQCVVQQVSALRVAAAPGKPVLVDYPIDFQPEPIP